LKEHKLAGDVNRQGALKQRVRKRGGWVCMYNFFGWNSINQ